jgi:hypothetical protein
MIAREMKRSSKSRMFESLDAAKLANMQSFEHFSAHLVRRLLGNNA